MSDSNENRTWQNLDNLPPEEKIIWEILKNGKFRALNFKRQHPIIYHINDHEPAYFIADFYCADIKLVIELERSHQDSRREHGQFLDQILKDMNIRVLRIETGKLSDIHWMLKQIERYI